MFSSRPIVAASLTCLAGVGGAFLIRLARASLSRSSSGVAAAAAAAKLKSDEFKAVAAEYAKFRPVYPTEMLTDLAAFHERHANSTPDKAVVLDIGTGSGQAAVALAEIGFGKVIGLDKSEAQLKKAKSHPRVEYRTGTDVTTGMDNESVNVITVAQAAHWFDLNAFSREAKRVLSERGSLAIMGYAVCHILEPAEAEPIFAAYYSSLDNYWSKECDRNLLDNGFHGAVLPFENVTHKWYHQRTKLTFESFMGYVRTWSALDKYKELHPGQDPSQELERKLLSLGSIKDKNSEIVIDYPFFSVLMTRPAPGAHVAATPVNAKH